MPTTATYTELDALSASFAELDALLSELKPSEWERPTRCAPMTIKQLVCHLASGQRRANSLVADAPSEAVTVDRLKWWRYDAEAVAPRLLESAIQDADGKSAAEAHEWLREEYAQVGETFANATALAGRKGVIITVADLASARTLETAVHTMDVGHASLRGERIALAAIPSIIEVLEGLAGGPMPGAIGWDRRTFILTATGRRRLSANEALTLGELASSFPLLK